MNEEITNQLLKFLAEEQGSRVSCGGRWMVVNADKEGLTYTVYEHPRRKTITLYDGHYLSTALQFLKGDIK